MEFFEAFTTLDGLVALATLTLLEIVLGIDNIVFISIVSAGLERVEQRKARLLGIALALIIRIMLLFSITWIAGLTYPVVTLLENELSWRDLILLGGGLFLIYKSTKELGRRLDEPDKAKKSKDVLSVVIFQIVVTDIVFSFDSIITAVGLSRNLPIMITAVVISMIVMLIAARPISDFIHRHPTFKVLALSFLFMIGVLLMAEGFGVHVPKGYAYFAMAFSLTVEVINLRTRKERAPVKLNNDELPD